MVYSHSISLRTSESLVLAAGIEPFMGSVDLFFASELWLTQSPRHFLGKPLGLFKGNPQDAYLAYAKK